MLIRKKMFKYFKKPLKVLVFLDLHGFIHLPDDLFLKINYKVMLGKKLNLDNPKTYNEKLQWLKLHDRKDDYTKLVDKYEVKDYISKKIGEEYIIPTLEVYDKFDEINFNELPDQFVIKCTHDSGGLVICKDKAKLDKEAARRKINKCLKRNFYCRGREWPYKNVKPRIIVEKYMEGFDGDDLVDYKFFCFNGKPDVILACSERFSGGGLKETWFDANWNLLPIIEGGHGIDAKVRRPKELEKMKNLAAKIAKGKAFVRVDFYEVEGKVYFGEITFFPCSGYERFDPEDWDRKLGDKIDLSIVEVEANHKT